MSDIVRAPCYFS